MFTSIIPPNSGFLFQVGPRWDGPAFVTQLIVDLATYGYQVPAGDQYEQLIYAAPPEVPAADPVDLATITPDKLRTIALERAHDQVTADAAHERLLDLKTELFAQWRTWITDRDDAIVEYLAPLFDRAAARARTLAAAGVKPGDGAVQVIEHDASVVAAWKAYERQDVPELERLATMRISLAFWTGRAPLDHVIRWRIAEPNYADTVDVTPLLLGGAEDGLPRAEQRKEVASEFFLRCAARLKLATTAEVEQGWTDRHGDAEPVRKLSEELSVTANPDDTRYWAKAEDNGCSGSGRLLSSTEGYVPRVAAAGPMCSTSRSK